MSDAYQPFRRAVPVWLRGRSEEINVQCGWRAVIDGGRRVRVLVATSGLYRLTVDGAFVAHGPARAAHGFFRVDEHAIELAAGPRVVALEVSGCFMDSYWVVRQPSFVQAEISDERSILAATGDGADGFAAVHPVGRVQRVQRYAKQRVASEAYRRTPGDDAWRADPAWRGAAQPVEALAARTLLPRAVPAPAYPSFGVARVRAEGALARHRPPERLVRFWWQDTVGKQITGYRDEEFETDPLTALQAKPTERIAAADRAARFPIALADHAFQVLDLGANRSGFLRARVRCDRPCRFTLQFDEIAGDDGDVDWLRAHCVNAVEWALAPGTHELETIEPYTARFLKAIALDGGCAIEAIGMRGYENGDAQRARFACADPRLMRVFEAARATFAQNAVDLFTDCPSRERAGWLCDSFFTGRIARDLCGTTAVERAFLENFVLPDRFAGLPEGMLPMCYPADHDDGNFIPNWAMWFVLELEEYLARSGDRALVDAARPRVEQLVAYLRGFENADGLLEQLPKWVFVEWSKANDFVQDVNYPSNMLWAAMLDAAARLWRRDEWSALAARVRATVRAQSFDGRFFVDNAVRRDGRLERTTNTSEVCQYYAFFTGVADAARDGGLWRTLVDDFGPGRRQRGTHPTVHPANAFIGNYLRLELLSRAGLADRVVAESTGFFLGMAERTGTLWEHDAPSASCDHGFAAHIAHAYYRDLLGLAEIDVVGRRLVVRLHPHEPAWCEGRVPVGGDDAIDLAWWREAGAVSYRLTVPAGWAVTVDDRTGGAVRVY